MYKEAHVILDQLKDAVSKNMESLKAHFVYFEWVLVAKKVFYKSYFQQRSLEILQAALKVVPATGENKEDATRLDYYRCKIYENLAYIYSE